MKALRPALLLALALAGALGGVPVRAQGDGTVDVGAQRQRIREERARIEATRSEQEAQCRQRFAVSDCLSQARARWREPLADLRRQEVALGDIERQRRSAAQQRKAQERQAPEAREAEDRRRQEALQDQKDREARAASKAGGPRPGGNPRGSEAGASVPALPSSAQARERAADHAQRVQEAQRRKQEVLRREAARSQPAASGLPTPP